MGQGWRVRRRPEPWPYACARTYARGPLRQYRGGDLSARIRRTVFARCAARLRDGQPCGRTVSPGSEFCSHHGSLVGVHGVDALMEGLPRRRASAQSKPPKVVTTKSQADDEVPSVSENGSRDPATVRPCLAEAAAEGLDGIRKTLLDAATRAVRDRWVTFECGECGARKRVEVPVPDVRARVAAIELLLREGLGRPPQAEEAPAPRLPASVGAFVQMNGMTCRSSAQRCSPTRSRQSCAAKVMSSFANDSRHCLHASELSCAMRWPSARRSDRECPALTASLPIKSSDHFSLELGTSMADV